MIRVEAKKGFDEIKYSFLTLNESQRKPVEWT